MMNDLVRRYFDGELDDREATDLLRALESDPELAAEVAATEKILELAGSLPLPPVTGNFTDKVMAQITAAAGTGQTATPRSYPRPTWSRPTLLVASWVLAIGLGFFMSQGLPGISPRQASRPGNSPLPATARQASVRTETAIGSVRMVRFAYQPRAGEVVKVAVAGSFNSWDPRRSPMHPEDGLWVADLLLPAGSYDYMFVVNDTTWITDPLAITTRNDGFGRRNAVLELGL